MNETWNALWLIPLLPLVGSAICGALHLRTLALRRQDPATDGPSGFAAPVAATCVAGAFALALTAFFKLTTIDGTGLESSTWDWIQASDELSIGIAMVADRLSSVLLLVITGVGLLIHVYSGGYMKGDPGFAKFFAYLNLFVFAMLILVLSSSLLGLFVGWEGVGLCSYLLIGFWYEKGWPAAAGQKAFVVNRIGDACFLLGSFLLVRVFLTLDLSTIAEGVTPTLVAAHGTELTIAVLLLFGGACGKSAQWPLFNWLPDAMAGPTPVSALIHAATMVTAGVYLVVRLNPLYAAAPTVMLVIGAVGAFTALIGATTALCQQDIKKVLAYSTVSQLGYMFLALGTGAWAAAVFHLVTHAFFKGLLFLGAGSVIHGMHEEQDMRKMGGLRKAMPRTFLTFLAGSAALSGLPLMSGFFSKDEILAHTFHHGGVYWVLWAVGIAVAAMTAFYTWRMVALTFFGTPRFGDEVHPHESPAVMTVPLMVLAVLSVFGGAIGLPHVFFGVHHFLSDWLLPVTEDSQAFLGAPEHLPALTEWILLGLGSAIALGFAHLGFHTYKRGPAGDERLFGKRPQLAGFLGEAWTIDKTYERVIVRPIKLLAFLIAVVVDQFAIDGAVNGAGALARTAAGKLRTVVDGSVKSYALWMGAGAATLAVLWIFGGAA